MKKSKKSDYKTVKKLYFSAFPKKERQPYFIMKRAAENGKGDFYIAKKNDDFVGFAYVIPYEDMAYLNYFAVNEKIRGKGYGSEILTELKKIYEGKRFFLARETLDSASDNYTQRVKRHNFYLKNGFEDLPLLKIKEASVIFDVMGIGGTIKKEEYDALMTNYCGNILRKFIRMELFEVT